MVHIDVLRDEMDAVRGKLTGAKQRIVELEGENARLKTFVIARICTGHREVPITRSCEFGHRICLEARAALTGDESCG